ncbi:MAG: histidine kinase [Lachnospiraceae bacterium]|nr:histidine kinase [Lachnospiraceae bacterium]
MEGKVLKNKNKVIIKFIMFLVICLGVYFGYVTYNTYSSILDNIYDNMDLVVDANVDSLSQSLDMMRNITLSLSGSDSISAWRYDQDYFLKGGKDSYLNQEKLTNEVQKILINSNVWSFNLFDYVAVYEDETLLTYTFTMPYSPQQIIVSSATAWGQIKNNENYAMMLPPTAENGNVYTTLRVQADFTGDHSIYIIGATSEKYFADRLAQVKGYDDALVYLTDKSGVVYASADQTRLGESIGDELPMAKGAVKKYLSLNGTDYLYIKKSINNDFNFVYLLPKSEIIKDVLSGMKLYMLITMILIVVMAVVFKQMTDEFKALVKSSYESKILLDEMEIRYLQHQMNPHFLFNILLTIQIKAKMNGDESVYKMISSLSTLLRAGIYGEKQPIVEIREELKYVEFYLSLQKERYEDRLFYNIEVEDEELLSCRIPRLIVEPMVENAVVHGIEDMEKVGVVNVIVRRSGDDIVISVSDNGLGFDINELEKDRTADLENGTIKREKLGLSNTDHRLKLLYGEDYGLKIKSEKNKGTDIEIRIPYKKVEA